MSVQDVVLKRFVMSYIFHELGSQYVCMYLLDTGCYQSLTVLNSSGKATIIKKNYSRDQTLLIDGSTIFSIQLLSRQTSFISFLAV